MTDLIVDTRVSAVEGNLLEFLDTVRTNPHFGSDGQPDATTFFHTAAIAFPLVNGVAAARFAPEDAARRTVEVLDPFVERGLPFLWWLTPSTTTPETEQALELAGLLRGDTPGMHVGLTGPTGTRPVPGLAVRVAQPGEERAVFEVMAEGFGMPPELLAPLHDLMGGLAPDRLVHVLATLDGEAVASGSLWVTGTVGGLYNIATVERARGRGVGLAVTGALMDLAHERGCTEAILHATEQGRPVYERLGFVEVCATPQYVWLPPEDARPGAD
ncbi:MAG: family N-acetyltransferase [Nocardioides sp.]|nr:family N-acetyltransferase [Nocardioides sp.]